MRSAALLPFFCIALGALAPSARADDRCLHLRHLHSPEPGKVRALVEVDVGCPAPRADLSLLLPGGAARDLTVGDNRAATTTVLVLDESTSYRGQRPAALVASDAYLGALGDGRVALVLFGGDAETPSPPQPAAEVRKRLQSLQGRPGGARGSTNLLSALNAALAVLAREKVAPGLGEVILLSDGGDEKGADRREWDDLRDRAERGGVRVSAVVPPLRAVLPRRQMEALAQLRQLAERTQGLYLNDRAGTDAAASLRARRDVARGWLALEGRLCGVPRGAANLSVRVEYAPGGTRAAWTDTRPFTPEWAPGSEAPCASACSPPCAPHQTCSAGACQARTCTSDAVCGPGLACVSGACAEKAPSGSDRQRLFIAAAGLGALVLGALALFFLTRKKPAPPVEPVPAAESAPAPPPVEAESALPEVYLQARSGALPTGQRWRLAGRTVQVGGSADPSDGNDIVLTVPQLSGRHARFEIYPSGAVWLTDLGTTNGTFVNGRRLGANERTAVRPGDVVQLSQQVALDLVLAGAMPARTDPKGDGKPDAKTDARADAKKKTQFDPGNR